MSAWQRSVDALAGMTGQVRAANRAAEIAAEWRTAWAADPTVEVFSARLNAVTGPCAHPDAVPVVLLLTGETAAWLCPDCDRQLPAGWSTVNVNAGPGSG